MNLSKFKSDCEQKFERIYSYSSQLLGNSVLYKNNLELTSDYADTPVAPFGIKNRKAIGMKVQRA